MTSIPLVRILQWNAAFGPSGNTNERAAILIEDLSSCLEELSRSADTAELLLKKDCPGEAASLGAKVGAAIKLLRVVRCETCRGWGRIDELGGGSRPCRDCTPLLECPGCFRKAPGCSSPDCPMVQHHTSSVSRPHHSPTEE